MRTIRPYSHRRPSETAAAERLVRDAVNGTVDALILASAPATAGLFDVAAELGCAGVLRESLAGPLLVAAATPAAAHAAERHGAFVSTCPVQPTSAGLVSMLAAAVRMRRSLVPVSVDAEDRTVQVGPRSVQLTDLQLRLFAALNRRQEMTCAREVLAREVWGRPVPAHRLETLVSRLRHNVAPVGLEIVPVARRGYRLQATR